jgi:hypothetical protein
MTAPDREPLTPRQRATLLAFVALSERLNRTPSYREIAREMRITVSAVYSKMKVLCRKRYIVMPAMVIIPPIPEDAPATRGPLPRRLRP